MKKLIILFLILMCSALTYAYDSGTPSFEEYPNIESNQFRFESLKYEPYPTTPGDYFEVWVKITNYGAEEMSDVTIELFEEYPFSSYDGEDAINLGKMNVNQQFVVKFKVKVDDGAVEGTEKLKIKAYENEWAYPVTFELPIDIQTRSASVDVASIETIPEKIIPGSKATINVKLKNTASTLMRDITVKLDLNGVPFTPLNSVNEKKIRKLSPNEETIASFDVIADSDAESKPYKVPIYFTFYDGLDNLESKNYTVGLLIDSKAELQLDIEDSEVHIKGDSGKVVVSISNVGPTDLKFVSIKILEDEKYKIIGTNRIYLGNLDSDDFETAEFTISSKSSKDILLKILVEYKNAYNEDNNEIYNVPLQMYSKNQAIAYGLTAPANGFSFIFYIIFAIFLYCWYKEWKLHKDLGKSFKIVAVRWAKKIINFLRPRNLKRIFAETPKKIKKFLKE